MWLAVFVHSSNHRSMEVSTAACPQEYGKNTVREIIKNPNDSFYRFNYKIGKEFFLCAKILSRNDKKITEFCTSQFHIHCLLSEYYCSVCFLQQPSMAVLKLITKVDQHHTLWWWRYPLSFRWYNRGCKYRNLRSS